MTNVNCEFKISRLCKLSYYISDAAVKANLIRNDGKFRCLYCGIEATHRGENSHYFKYKKNDDYFSNIDSDDKAYLLGVIAGDGFVGEKLISLVANSKDVETLDKLVSKIFYISPKYTKSGNCFSISITSKNMSDDICRHLKIAYGKKSNKITIPDLEDNLKWAFIRGLFDTDGCVGSIYAKQKSPSCFCSSTSIKILEQIKEIVSSEGIKSSITGVKLKFNGKQAINFMKKLYNNNNLSLSRKKNMFKLWENWEPLPPGSRVSLRRKLTIEQIKNLRLDVSLAVLTTRQMAKKYSISLATLHSIKIGETYKDYI